MVIIMVTTNRYAAALLGFGLSLILDYMPMLYVHVPPLFESIPASQIKSLLLNLA